MDPKSPNEQEPEVKNMPESEPEVEAPRRADDTEKKDESKDEEMPAAEPT